MNSAKSTNPKLKKFLGILGILILILISYLAGELLPKDERFILRALLFIPLLILYPLIDDNSFFHQKRSQIKVLVIKCVCIALFLYWFGGKIDARECFALLGLMAYLLFYNYEKLVKELGSKYEEIENIQHYLSSRDDIGYRLDVEVSPNWNAILKKIFKDEQLITKLIKEENTQHIKDECISDKGLINKVLTIGFTEFNSKNTALPMICSNFNEGFFKGIFLKEMKVSGNLFKEGGALEKELCKVSGRVTSTGHMLQPLFDITPSYIGFANAVEGYKESFSSIPFNEIVELLLDIAKNNDPDNTINIIRQFPLPLQQKLDQCNVKYDPFYLGYHSEDSGENLKMYSKKAKDWASKNGVVLSTRTAKSHKFQAECFSVYISIECCANENQFNNK